MTRENKLALVIGFALILFVGVLVSDHFSAAANERAADFTTPDSALVAANMNTHRIIDLTPPEARPPVRTARVPAGAQDLDRVADPMPPIPGGANSGVTANRNVDAGDGDIPGFVRADGPGEVPTEIVNMDGLSDRLNDNSAVSFHDVRPGETLYSICRQHYGNAALLKSLARYNSIGDPANLNVGRRLRIPTAPELAEGRPASRSVDPPALPALDIHPRSDSTASGHSFYTVRAGDSLSKIARQILGSSSRYQEIIDVNSDALSDPDDLRVGSRLRIPVNASVRR